MRDPIDPIRRSVVLRGLAGCALCGAAQALSARVLPSSMAPLIAAGYEPEDADERGLWQVCDRLEQRLGESDLVVRDEALNTYVRGIVERLMGAASTDLRIYIVRDAEFNASMAPNGMMLIHTGMLARVRNEAQAAAVLGHECGHYLRLHSLQGWRDRRTKTAFMAFLAVGGAAATGATGNNWYDLANAINNALVMSLFSFSREQESEADAYGINLMEKAGYTPQAAGEVWAQLIEERKASVAVRGAKYKDGARSAFSTHPPSEDRMRDLNESARDIERMRVGDSAFEDGRESWQAAMSAWRPMLLEEQIKLNDPGASLHLLKNQARDGWDGVLRFYEGEVYRLRGAPGDAELAAAAYADAIEQANAPTEAHKAHGYARLKAGDREEGVRALARYLELHPEAADAAMIRFVLAQ